MWPRFSPPAPTRPNRGTLGSTCSRIGTADDFEEALLRASARDELGVAFQPKVSCVDGRIIGYEALVRWTHPTLGAIPPDAFIPRAESLHLVHIVTDSVAATAMAWFASARSHTDEHLAINISATELTDSRLGRQVAREVRRGGSRPQPRRSRGDGNERGHERHRVPRGAHAPAARRLPALDRRLWHGVLVDGAAVDDAVHRGEDRPVVRAATWARPRPPTSWSGRCCS